MRIDILTVLPEMIEGFFDCSIMARAKKKGLADIVIHNIRDYTTDKHRRTDDYPFGGCAGMVMKIEPIDNLIAKLKSERHYDEVIFTTPDGEQWNQKMANTMSMCENLIILCGHFKGIDYRIREHLITKEVSIGDYVLTGGELAAAVMADSLGRIIPGVMSSRHCLIRSKIICWLPQYIPVLQNTKVGVCLMCYCQDMRPRYVSGNSNNRWSVHVDCAQTCWVNK